MKDENLNFLKENIIDKDLFDFFLEHEDHYEFYVFHFNMEDTSCSDFEFEHLNEAIETYKKEKPTDKNDRVELVYSEVDGNLDLVVMSKTLKKKA